MACCFCSADDFIPDYMRWDQHPAHAQWEVVKDLGQGSFSQVVLARHRVSGELAALKVVFLRNPEADAECLAVLEREGDLLAMLDHPNIVECKDILRDERQMVMVLEWLRGGQVVDGLHEIGASYGERQAAEVFVQVAEAVACLHEYSILHRDIKPENILFATPPSELRGRGQSQGPAPPLASVALRRDAAKTKAAALTVPVVKLVDLGMACIYDPEKPVHGPLGSAGFVAPEVVQDGVHTPAMDVYSLGVLLFIMLVGRKPYNFDDCESLRYAYRSLQDAPGLKDPRWLDLSPDAKHLLMGLLASDPGRRLTSAQVLQHEWVVGRGGALPRPLGLDVAYGAATVASVRRLKNLTGNTAVIVRGLAPSASGGSAAPAAGNASASGRSGREEYLHRLRRAQRRDASFRGGSGGMQGLVRGMAAKSYGRLHDTGRVIDPADDVSVHCHPLSPEGSSPGGGASHRGRRSAHRSASSMGGSSGGLSSLPRRAQTAVMLSEMSRAEGECSPDGSRRRGSGMLRAPSTLRLLGKSLRQLVDSSIHGGGSVHSRSAGRHGSTRGGGGYGDASASNHGRAAAAAAAAAAELPAIPRPQPGASPEPAGPASPGRPPLPSPLPAGDLSTGSASSHEYLRPHRVVKRASIDNPLFPSSSPAAQTPGRTWTEMQAVLRAATPRRSRDDSSNGSTHTRVNVIKPL